MELFKKKIGRVFLKDTSDATNVIDQLEAYYLKKYKNEVTV